MITKHLLNDKFLMAKLPNFCLHRDGLVTTFCRLAESNLIIVSAPAGYGKTVSTQLWLEDSGRKTIWIGLDGYDNSPSIFYKLLCRGIFSVQPSNKAIEKILTSASFASSPVEHTIRLLAEFAPDGREYALVLDDMHLVTNKGLLKSWPIVKKRLPLSFVTLILTRNEVSEEYISVFGEGRYSVITSKDLVFSVDEIKKFFSVHGHSLTSDEAEKVHSITDGWAMGVSALALSGQPDTGQDGVRILGRYVKKNIWDKWDAGMQDFMIKTSLTDEITIKLCEILTGRMNSAEVLERMRSENPFISRISDDTYCYHSLFLEFLRGQAEEYGLETKEYYKAAAKYYIENGDYFMARRYARRSGDADLMAEVVYHLYQFGNASLDEFVSFSKLYADEVPTEKICDQAPFLYAILMWECYLLGNAEKMEYYLDKLYRFLPVIAQKYPRDYESVVMQMSLDHRIPLPELFKKFSSLPPFKHYHESLQGATFTHEMPFMHRGDRDYSDLVTGKLRDELRTTYGQLFREDCELIVSTLESGIYIEKNQSKEALATALHTKNLINEETRVELCFCAYIHLAAAYYDLRNPVYNEIMTELEAFINKRNIQYLRPNLIAVKTKMLLLDGNKKAALEWLGNYYVTDTEHLKLYKIYQHFATAKAYTVLGKTDKAMSYALKLKKLGTDFCRPLDIAEAGVLKSVLEWALGMKKEAQITLEAVLKDMQPYGFVRVISIEGAAVLPILKRIAAKMKKDAYDGGLRINYVQKVILAAYEQSRRHKGIAANINASAVNLSKQQKRILLILSEGYSYAEAAEKSGISIHTVKSHAMAAYEKLGVHSSLDAAAKARELGLIN